MTDIMIDLETLSTRSDAAIVSIGAVAFDIKTGKVLDTLYKTIALSDQPHYGHIDPATVRWWLQQSDDARKAITDMEQPLHPRLALAFASAFIALYNATEKNKLQLWSNGSSFDLVILRNAFQRFGMRPAWNHWQERDCRTLVDLARDIAGVDVKQTTPFTGTAHNALDDALHQAAYVSAAYQALSKRQGASQ